MSHIIASSAFLAIILLLASALGDTWIEGIFPAIPALAGF